MHAGITVKSFGGSRGSREIATKIAYRTMVAAAPVLPVGYVVSARRIADRRMILVGYRLADLLARVVGN
jgi:hypothetical protein